MTKLDLNILKTARLIVAGDVISVEEDNPDIVAALAFLRSPPNPDPVQILARVYQILTGGPRGRAGAVNVAGGALHKGLHKNLHKNLHQNLHTSSGAMGGAGAPMLDWPTIEVPWREIGRLEALRPTTHWDNLPIELPPPIEKRIGETSALLEKQRRLRHPAHAWRRARIVKEAGNDLSAYMLPLGTNVTGPGTATALMFQTLLWLGSQIGLRYKARFNVSRPHELNPMVEPAIPVPAFSAYPSNHALQSFLIAEMFARAVPEHPGIPALFCAAETVAENREWAGLHVKSDTDAGRHLARLLMPVMEVVMEDQIAAVRDEWYRGE